MISATTKFHRFNIRSPWGRAGALAFLTLCAIGCDDLQRPKVEPFYSVTVPPPKQELRWTNGKLPKILDPARAATAPETDIVRAAYEGLTELDSRSLQETPAVAERWEASEDLRTWIFYLRKDARWSNGERVTARDFVRSWKRLGRLGNKAANSYLFENILGIGGDPSETPSDVPGDFIPEPPGTPATASEPTTAAQDPAPGLSAQLRPPESIDIPEPPKRKNVIQPGIVALDDITLRVILKNPDKDFPKLVANPIFRPIYGNGNNFEQPGLDPESVTNGAFRIDSISSDGIVLTRSDNYWNKRSIALERVRFVPAASAESALEAYRRGAVDVISNAAFQPLALKLLSPYDDFRRSPHNAINLYEINTYRAPFNDRRVREALALATDRRKLAESDLEGTTQPAISFLPFGGQNNEEALSYDVESARQLLVRAGFSDGKNFPRVRLVINRNDAQQRVARSVARMWKENLNIETEIVVKESSEIEAVRESGDFDIVRRGLVLPTNDEYVSLSAILGAPKPEPAASSSIEPKPAADENRERPTRPPSGPSIGLPDPGMPENSVSTLQNTKETAIFEVRVIPLYFPTSYALVKPYVRGFEMNILDAPSLKEVSIDSSWQPKPATP
ncbi:MAG: peptide ABC transporter substrate-binding protein [Pyrinomonadaceae bacterium]